MITLARHEQRLVLTEDKDFGDLVFRRERAIPGIVLMRIGPEHPALKAMRLAAAIERYREGKVKSASGGGGAGAAGGGATATGQ